MIIKRKTKLVKEYNFYQTLWGHIFGCPTIFPPHSTTRFNCLQCTVQVESICFVECLYDQWKSFAVNYKFVYVNYKFVPPFQIQFLGLQYVKMFKFKLPPSDNSLKDFMKNHLCNLKLFFMPCSKCRRLVVLLCMKFISCIIFYMKTLKTGCRLRSCSFSPKWILIFSFSRLKCTLLAVLMLFFKMQYLKILLLKR